MVQDPPILSNAEKFGIISKNSSEGIIIINDSGTIEEWNDYMSDKTPYSKSDVSGRKIWDVQFSLLTRELKKKYTRKSLQYIWLSYLHDLKENEYTTKEGQFVARNNEIILTEDVISRINFHNKNYLCVIQRDRRIGKRIAYEDIVMSFAVQELKSLIYSFLDFSEPYSRESRELKIDKLLHSIEKILSSSENAIRLLENLSVFMEIQKGNFGFNPVKADVNAIIQEIIEEYKSSAANKNIRLNYLPSSEIMCTADIKALKLIIRNLVDNAVKFTPVGGIVDVSVVSKEEFVEFRITDNGAGITDEIRRKLFLSSSNISSRGTAGEEGAGLGLILCKNLVEKHGGQISVESTVNKSSTFIFTIPVDLLFSE
jgi:PAS domain S-box-containing protein